MLQMYSGEFAGDFDQRNKYISQYPTATSVSIYQFKPSGMSGCVQVPVFSRYTKTTDPHWYGAS